MSISIWTFSVGDVFFEKFEVPEQFETGYEVKTAVHKYLSETGTPITVVHSQGAFPLPSSWTGILYGNTAIQRMLAIGTLATNEQPVTFTWGPLSWIVHIDKVKFTPKYNNEIAYEIDITVITDQNGQGNTIDNGLSFDVGTQAFFDTTTAEYAALQSLPIDLPDSLTSATDDLNSQFLSAVPIKTASFSTLTNILNQLQATIVVYSAFVSALQASAIIENDLAALNAALNALNAYILLQFNIQQLVGVGSVSVKSVQFSGWLFELAAQYYPASDVSLAAQLIAQANGLNDYYLPTVETLVLPPVFN